jgi:glycine oxidase
VKTWDCIVVGGGVIGLSVALELRRAGADVALIDKSEPGREASHAAGGMIADLDPSLPEALRPLANASAAMYQEFVHLLEDESSLKIDFRTNGTIAFVEHAVRESDAVRALSADEVKALESAIEPPHDPAYFVRENAVDPRTLIAALLATVRHRQVEVATGSPVVEVITENGVAMGVRTERAVYHAKAIVNCAGAWAAQIAPLAIPTRPVKGHMLSLVFPEATEAVLTHVVRSRWCYVLPRSTGKYVVGSTVEPAGFDKSVNAYKVKKLQEAAVRLVPKFAGARLHEAWAGLRPGTPDNLPIIGETSLRNYYACTGHYRDGILLAPASARATAQIIQGKNCEWNLSAFSPARFGI